MTGRQDLQCLICQVPITQCHLGIDSCRACAVFYKRCLNLKRPLKCKEGGNGCLAEDPTSSCRQCRFERFKEVFDRACAGETPDWLQKEEKEEDIEDSLSDSEGSSEREPIEEPMPSFIDHNSYFDCAPSCSDTPVLDRIKKAYSVMCLVRKSGEMAVLQHAEVHETLRPSKYSVVVPFSRIFLSAALDFARASFDAFNNMSAETRHFIVFRNFKLLMSLDGAYRAHHHFPADEAIMASYSTFINDDTMDAFFEDCPFDTNKKDAAEEFKKNLKRTSVANKEHFKRVKPSSEEFAALMGLALWNDNSDTSTVRSDLLPLVSSNRAAIMSELHKMYAQKGMSDYAPRLGELLCLLINVERAQDLINEDIHVYRMMNLFNEAFEDVRI